MTQEIFYEQFGRLLGCLSPPCHPTAFGSDLVTESRAFLPWALLQQTKFFNSAIFILFCIQKLTVPGLELRAAVEFHRASHGLADLLVVCRSRLRRPVDKLFLFAPCVINS